MNRAHQLCDRYPISAFLFLAFGIAWVLWIPGLVISHGKFVTFGGFGIYSPALAGMILSHRGKVAKQSRSKARAICFLLVALLAVLVFVLFHKLRLHEVVSAQMVIPAALISIIVAWIASGAYSRDYGTREFLWTLVHSRRWGWQLIALGCFAAYLLLPAALFHLLGRPVSPANLGGGPGYLALLPISFASTFFFGGGVSEEPGWRGFLLPHLQQKYSPFLSSIFVWLPWALWHAPLDYTGWVGLSMEGYLRNRALLLLPLTILTTWLYNRSGKTILSAALFHTAFNVFPDFLPSVPGMIWLLYLWTVVVVITDRMWQPIREPQSRYCHTPTHSGRR